MSNRVDGAVAAYPLFQAVDGGSIPTSTLQFHIREIDVRLAQNLNKKWHSLLPRTSYRNIVNGHHAAFVAEYEGKYYAVAIWSPPTARHMNNGKTIELRRLAVCSDAPKNTPSRMMKICKILLRKKFPNIVRAISYQAVSVHAGTIYKAAGWNAVGRQRKARKQRHHGEKGGSTLPPQMSSSTQRWETSL